LIDLDMDAPEMDLEMDFDADFDLGSGSGLGMVTIRALNLTAVPIVVWGGCFTLLWWLTSSVLWSVMDGSNYDGTWLTAAMLSGRSAVIAVAMTKIVTEPMKKWFVTSRYTAAGLIGKPCEVATGEATKDFGQAKFKTDAAPLLLNIRTDGVTLHKGDRAKIIDFDETNRIYTVTTWDDEE